MNEYIIFRTRGVMVMPEKWTKEDMEQWEWCQNYSRIKRLKRKRRKLHWEQVKFDFRSMVYHLKCVISNIF